MVLGRELGRGARSIVYSWEHGDAVKLPLSTTPERWLGDELHLAEVAHRAGAPTPGGWRLVDVDGVAGLVSRRVDGPSMWQVLVDEPARAEELAETLARLQVRLFSGPSTYDLPRQGDRIRAKIRSAARRFDRRLLHALELLPSAGRWTALCHGDLHPRNVMLHRDGPVLVDWFDAARGDPVADVARTSLLLSEADAPHQPGPSPTPDTVARFHRRYLRELTDAVAVGDEVLTRWRTVHRVARLAEGFGLDGIEDLVGAVSSERRSAPDGMTNPV